mgnify:CR=1 FL=1
MVCTLPKLVTVWLDWLRIAHSIWRWKKLKQTIIWIQHTVSLLFINLLPLHTCFFLYLEKLLEFFNRIILFDLPKGILLMLQCTFSYSQIGDTDDSAIWLLSSVWRNLTFTLYNKKSGFFSWYWQRKYCHEKKWINTTW